MKLLLFFLTYFLGLNARKEAQSHDYYSPFQLFDNAGLSGLIDAWPVVNSLKQSELFSIFFHFQSLHLQYFFNFH